MKKKTKRNLIIAAIVIVLIAAGAAWFIYPFIRYSSHTLAYRSALPGNACYQYPIQYSKEGWFLIDLYPQRHAQSSAPYRHASDKPYARRFHPSLRWRILGESAD